VSVVDFPAVMVLLAAVKLVIDGAGLELPQATSITAMVSAATPTRARNALPRRIILRETETMQFFIANPSLADDHGRSCNLASGLPRYKR
jgi:hypothetical protein